MFSGLKILIIGGTGSLGNALIKRYLKNNKIIVYSRDENKHWQMSLIYNSENLEYMIGCIRDYKRLENVILNTLPDLIIVAAALKHIDRCEYSVTEALATNYTGVYNVFDIVSKNQKNLQNLKCCVFISTDKACSPVNTYGITKALAEKIVIEKSLECKTTKCVTVRYGNVLNSRGSIIPILKEKANDPNVKEFTLTDENMTRFVMTLEDSINLIEVAITQGESGDIVIPKPISLKIKDLFEIFSEEYKKPIKIIGLRPSEKMFESLINETQSASMIEKNNYYFLKPSYRNIYSPELSKDYNSDLLVINKEELKKLLKNNNLL